MCASPPDNRLGRRPACSVGCALTGPWQPLVAFHPTRLTPCAPRRAVRRGRLSASCGFRPGAGALLEGSGPAPDSRRGRGGAARRCSCSPASSGGSVSVRMWLVGRRGRFHRRLPYGVACRSRRVPVGRVPRAQLLRVCPDLHGRLLTGRGSVVAVGLRFRAAGLRVGGRVRRVRRTSRDRRVRRDGRVCLGLTRF